MAVLDEASGPSELGPLEAGAQGDGGRRDALRDLFWAA
jgi:hypothetical protein